MNKGIVEKLVGAKTNIPLVTEVLLEESGITTSDKFKKICENTITNTIYEEDKEAYMVTYMGFQARRGDDLKLYLKKFLKIITQWALK